MTLSLKKRTTKRLFNEVPLTKNQIREKYTMSPFSVLDARKGVWQKRKKLWISLGIESELGRENVKLWAKDSGTKEVSQKIRMVGEVSIFDPVLCELMYSWFCPKGGSILDPFAGGSVRGIVAGYLNYQYTGIDLSKSQIKANRVQGKEILETDSKVKWITGDSANMKKLTGKKHDFIFSCPQYYNLEIYQNSPKDLSNAKTYKEFLNHYYKIIKEGVSLLKNNRFACFVVSNIRDKKGFYHNLVGDTIRGFDKEGALFYNDCVLVTHIGSLSLRIEGQFSKNRKIGKTHQNVLIFYKGDITQIPSF